MQDNNEFEYRYTLKFPVARAYAVDDVMNLISKVACHCNQPNPIERIPFRSVSGKWGSDIDASHKVADERPTNDLSASQVTITEPENFENPNEHIEPTENILHAQEIYKRKTLDDYKLYLIDRLLKEVVEGKFELWDWTGSKVVDPPMNYASSSTKGLEAPRKPLDFNTIMSILGEETSPKGNSSPESTEPHLMPAFAVPAIISSTFRSNHRPVYQTAFWWAIMSTILKPDLIKFCSGEGINVLFEGEQTVNQVTITEHGHNASQINGIAQPKASQPVQEPEILCESNPAPPGKIPNVDIGKLAIEAAWEMECATGLPAAPKAVIKKLQEWSVIRKEKWLGEVTKTGVKWTSMVTGSEKDYGIGACTKTLQVWRKSYA